MRTITILAAKGGVGKTATAVNLAAAMHQRGHKTLLVDADQQGSAADYLLGRPDGPTTADWLMSTETAKGCTRVARKHSEEGGELHMMIGGNAMSHLKEDLRGTAGQGWDIGRYSDLKETVSRYDYVVVDCAPDIGPVEMSFVAGSDLLLTPMAMKPASARGIINVNKMYRDWSGHVKKHFGQMPPLLYLPTMLDGRIKVSRKMLEDVSESFGTYPEGQTLAPVRFSAAFMNSYYDQQSVYEIDGSRSAARAQEDIDELLDTIEAFEYGQR